MKLHATGQWFCKWGGKNHYLGADKAKAESEYRECLRQWTEWRDARSIHRPVPMTRVHLCVDLAEAFFRAKRLDRGEGAEAYYRKHMNRFIHLFGDIRADMIRPRALAELKEDMIQKRLKPKTICHDLTAVRVMFNWAVGMEYVPVVSFRGIRNPPLGPPPDKSMTIQEIRGLLKKTDANMRAWLSITYLALLRPSETVSVVNGRGKWVERGIFRLDRGKMDQITALPRHCVFSVQALACLKRCKPTWGRLDSYSQAVRGCLGNGNGPGRLRHSAASHLAKRGVDPASIELLLGHVPKRLAVTYYQPAWQRLRVTAARLKL